MPTDIKNSPPTASGAGSEPALGNPTSNGQFLASTVDGQRAWVDPPSGGSGSGSTWLYGSGAPSDASGANGDYYLRTSNGDVYRKALDTWGSPIANLTGPTGATGAAGADGADGADGATWLSGSSAPSDAAGNNGDHYLHTSTGDVYLKVDGTWGSPVANLMGPAGADGEGGAGGDPTPTRITATTYTITDATLILDNCTDTSTRERTLPASASTDDGHAITIVYNAGTRAISLLPNGTDTVDGAASYSMPVPGMSITVRLDKTAANWVPT